MTARFNFGTVTSAILVYRKLPLPPNKLSAEIPALQLCWMPALSNFGEVLIALLVDRILSLPHLPLPTDKISADLPTLQLC